MLATATIRILSALIIYGNPVTPTPLHDAIRRKDLSYVMDHANAINIQDLDESGKCVLTSAVEVGNDDIVTALILMGADVNYRSRRCISPLFTAVRLNRPKTTVLLLGNGANTSQSANGMYVLSYACYINSLEVAKHILLHTNINVNQPDKNGRTPLFYAANDKTGYIPNLLLQKGADLDVIEMYGFTPLFPAIATGNTAMVKLLMDRGVNLRQSSYSGLNALHFAAIWNKPSFAQSLIQHGIDVNSVDKNNQTPLSIASGFRWIQTVRLLLNSAADPNIADIHGAACLSKVLKFQKHLLFPTSSQLITFPEGHENENKFNVEVIAALIQAGADFNAPFGCHSVVEELTLPANILIKLGLIFHKPFFEIENPSPALRAFWQRLVHSIVKRDPEPHETFQEYLAFILRSNVSEDDLKAINFFNAELAVAAFEDIHLDAVHFLSQRFYETKKGLKIPPIPCARVIENKTFQIYCNIHTDETIAGKYLKSLPYGMLRSLLEEMNPSMQYMGKRRARTVEFLKINQHPDVKDARIDDENCSDEEITPFVVDLVESLNPK